MSEQQSQPDPDKLKRLLALALDAGAADGEIVNAIKAASKMVVSLGGFDKAMTSIGAGQPRQNASSGSNGFTKAAEDFMRGRAGSAGPGWEYRTYQNPFWWGGADFAGDAHDKAAKEREKAAAKAEQARKDAEQEAKDRREWELKRAMGQGVGIWEALRRRRLWKPNQTFDEMDEELMNGFKIFDYQDDMEAFSRELAEAQRNK